MHPIRFLVPLAVALVVVASPAAPDAAKAQAYLEALHTDFGYPGVSAAIGTKGAIAWSGAAGFSNLEKRTPATPGDVYRLGSVSKILTVAAVMQLVQEGKLDLDAPVQKYVPEFPEKDKGAITTRLLAGHLAGIPHYMAGDKPDTERPDYDGVIAAIAEYGNKPQLFAPGEKFRYSTYGYSLISAVVERAAGRPFPDYLNEAVFAPLGMTNTRVERAGEVVPGITTFYDMADRETVAVVPPMYVSYKWAGGGMLSTVDDLVRFGFAWLPGSSLFRPETLAVVFTSQKTNDGKETGTGIGWRVGLEPGKVTPYHHGGAIGGGRAFLLVDPEKGTVVAMLGNMLASRNFDAEQALELAGAFFE